MRDLVAYLLALGLAAYLVLTLVMAGGWAVTLGWAPWDWLGAHLDAQLAPWLPVSLPLPPPPAG